MVLGKTHPHPDLPLPYPIALIDPSENVSYLSLDLLENGEPRKQGRFHLGYSFESAHRGYQLQNGHVHIELGGLCLVCLLNSPRIQSGFPIVPPIISRATKLR